VTFHLPSRSRRLPTPGIPIAPLVDIVFNLLLFFMLISHYMQPALNVELPKSSTASAAAQGSVTIVIDARGDAYLDSQPVSDAALAQSLSALSPDNIALVRLRADERVGLQRVVEVLDIIRASPVKSVALEAVPK
jgi:biopolymer transport protein ExbD